MGGKSKKQTIGYKYFLGMHQALCHGPIDKITRITVDDRLAWSGNATGGAITVNAPALFGGEKREGGVSGTIDIEMGGPTQGRNAYLVQQLGNLIPAYRGVVSAIFRQCYLGNNPYLKPWRFRGQRIHVRQNGIAQWYNGVAAIYPAVISASQTQWRYLAIPRNDNVNRSAPSFDDSAWPVGITPFGNRDWTFSNPRPANNGLREKPETIISAVNAYWIRTKLNLQKVPTTLRIEAFIDNDAVFYVNGVQVASLGGPNGNFYTIDIPGTQLKVGENTFAVRFVDRVASDLGNWMWFDWRLIDLTTVDMNPAHIIRECLTDPDWGLGYTDADVDDQSFEAAADKLHSEGLGISLLWDKQIKLEEFIDEIKRHIDAAVYVSRTSGKFVVKLIRDDYDLNDLLLLDESNILKIDEATRLTLGELTNSVTVNYWDAQTGRDASLTIMDTALVQEQGAVVNVPLQYPGFTNSRNAAIAAERDLRALSTPGLKCTIIADASAKGLNVGDAFLLSWARWGVSSQVMRVVDISYGTGRNTQVRIACAQDIYATDTSVSVIVEPPSWTDPSSPPVVPPQTAAFEIPYYQLVQVNGQNNTDASLAAKPEIGYVGAAAGRTPAAINAILWTDDGSGYEEADQLDFAPYAVLSAAVTKTATTLLITDENDFENIEIGSFAQVGNELVRIDAYDANTGTLTVGRGVLDTVPQEHAAGAVVFCWDVSSAADPTEYVAGEEIGVKVTPVSGAGVLPLAEAAEVFVTLQQRAYRPYPPGDLRVNGDSYQDVAYNGELTLTWKHRDRVQQTGGALIDHTGADIGPEPGTTYRVQGYLNDVLVHAENDIAGTSATWTPPGDGQVRVEVHSKRDGILSLQAPSHFFLYVGEGALRFVEEENDIRVTEDNDSRGTED